MLGLTATALWERREIVNDYTVSFILLALKRIYWVSERNELVPHCPALWPSVLRRDDQTRPTISINFICKALIKINEILILEIIVSAMHFCPIIKRCHNSISMTQCIARPHTATCTAIPSQPQHVQFSSRFHTNKFIVSKLKPKVL